MLQEDIAGSVARILNRLVSCCKIASVVKPAPILFNLKVRVANFIKQSIEPSLQPSTQRPGAYLGCHRYLTTTIYGHKIFLDTRDVSLTPHIIIDGYWELWITEWIRSYLKPGMRVLEVGSNCGWYTLLMADKIGPQGTLITFEANPDLAQMTFDSVTINGFADRVKVHGLAASHKHGEATLRILSRFLGSSTLGHIDPSFLDHLSEKCTEITVKTVALDEFLQGSDRTIDLMKIDAEGAEPLVFQGMQQLLQESPDLMIVMEYSPNRIRACGQDPDEMMKNLFQMGFQAFQIKPNGQLPQRGLKQLRNATACELLLSRHAPQPVTPLPE